MENKTEQLKVIINGIPDLTLAPQDTIEAFIFGVLEEIKNMS